MVTDPTEIEAKLADMEVPVALGFHARRGGSVVVGVAVDDRAPRVVLSTFLPTAADGDRLAIEPYHIAAEMQRGSHGEVSASAAAAVAEGCERQRRLALTGLDEIVRTLRDARCTLVVTALLVNRAGWVADLLQYSLFAPEHPPVAEGLAVRDALRFALRTRSIDVVEMDEKSLLGVASTTLHVSPPDLNARLKELGTTAGRPWRKEQKLACLAAWVAVASRGSLRVR
jgi:hypothetical protein